MNENLKKYSNLLCTHLLSFKLMTLNIKWMNGVNGLKVLQHYGDFTLVFSS